MAPEAPCMRRYGDGVLMRRFPAGGTLPTSTDQDSQVPIGDGSNHFLTDVPENICLQPKLAPDNRSHMISIQPKKLLMSKWTAVKPMAKEKHFLVRKVVEPEHEGGKVEWIDLEAVHSKSTKRMAWIELRDSAQWVRGWV